MAITISTLRIRYPAMAAVADEVAGYWIEEAKRLVPLAWGDDREPAALALAAHNIAAAGAIPGALPAGVTSFRSGTFSATVSDAQAGARGFDATSYGIEYAKLLRRHSGAPFLAGCV